VKTKSIDNSIFLFDVARVLGAIYDNIKNGTLWLYTPPTAVILGKSKT